MNSKNTLFTKFYRAHVWLGLFISANIALLAVSGLILLFKDELQNSDTKSVRPVALQPNDYASALEQAQRQHPDTIPLAIFPDDHNSGVIKLRLGENGSTQLRGSKKVQIATAAASTARSESPLFAGLLEFHRELFLGKFGKFYVGIVGVLYSLLLVSGFFIYGRFMKNRRFTDIRSGEYLFRADYHKLLGIVSFGWSLLVAVTGVLLAFNGTIIKIFQMQTLNKLATKYAQSATDGLTSITGIDRVVASALAARPGQSIAYIAFPNTEFGVTGQHLVLLDAAGAVSESFSEILLVNSLNGMLTEAVPLPWYLSTLLAAEPLHFGDFGGPVLKLIWAGFTLCSLAVVYFGVSSFFKKRSRKHHTSVVSVASAAKAEF